MNHFLAFYVLALLTDFAFPRSAFGWHKALPLLAYGIAIELIQSQIPYRHCSLLDVIVNGVGILAYVLTLPLIRRLPVPRQPANSRNSDHGKT
ncbi:hypothetical protein CAI21_20315 [Alkalilimnicola ehrlichii]|uniref:VanZ-like domain-containing protein n=1 Tax=Alkalilimnicola ehrlichii TaxID=351052 RepID=A0A3E0WHU5_9GAMM|nr:hypothetical protein CAI21_20315 [Alkalilimnicola ehrlichii]RFA32019.1 hypothetical protein CAL65_20915 [Alkalilimnicola ehrlichii]